MKLNEDRLEASMIKIVYLSLLEAFKRIQMDSLPQNRKWDGSKDFCLFSLRKIN